MSLAIKLFLSTYLKKKGFKGILWLIVGITTWIPILIFILFSPKTVGAADGYSEAYEELSCPVDADYLLTDIRAYEAIVDPNTLGNITKEEATKRLKKIYLDINSSNEKKTCYMRSDDFILNELKNIYNLSDEKIESLLIEVKAIRNGRQTLICPLDSFTITTKYNENKGYMVFKENSDEEAIVVKSIASGKVVDIITDVSKIPIEEGITKEINQKITVEITLQQGLGEDGEYKTKKIYAVYGFLNSTNLNVGDTVEQGRELSTLDDEYLYFQLLNEEKNPIDPASYIYLKMVSGDWVEPFSDLYYITNPYGVLSYEKTHVGMDFDAFAHYGSDEIAVTDGEVISTETTCAPNGGSLGSTCGSIIMGGNHVVLKTEKDNETIYINYSHMADVFVYPGDHLYAGDVIGTQGHSGNSSASHLHFEMRNNTKWGSEEGSLNPEDYIELKGIRSY